MSTPTDNSITARIEKDRNGSERLLISLPFDRPGRPSATGKTRVHASTHGNVATTCEVDGRPLIVGVNAYTK